MNIIYIVVATLIAILLPFIGIKLGMKLFLFGLISLGSLVLIVLLSLTFMDVLALIISPWISPIVGKPVIVIVIAGTIIALALKMSKSIEEVLSDMSEAGNTAMGGALGLTIAILVIRLFLWPEGGR